MLLSEGQTCSHRRIFTTNKKRPLKKHMSQMSQSTPLPHFLYQPRAIIDSHSPYYSRYTHYSEPPPLKLSFLPHRKTEKKNRTDVTNVPTQIGHPTKPLSLSRPMCHKTRLRKSRPRRGLYTLISSAISLREEQVIQPSSCNDVMCRREFF